MIPVLICVPVLMNGNVDSTCFLPNPVVLLVHTLLLSVLVVVAVIINAIDADLGLGYLLHWFTVLGTLTFLSLGVMGYRRLSVRILMAAFIVWCITWFGYLLISIISVSNLYTLKAMSVNGRCPLNYWIFDWCEKIQMSRPKNKTEKQKMQQEIDNSHRPYTAYYFHTFEEDRSLKKNEISYFSDSLLDNQFPATSGGVSLTNIGGYQAYTSSPEHKRYMGYILGIFLVMLVIMGIYTMYGYVLLKILNQMKTTPILIVAR